MDKDQCRLPRFADIEGHQVKGNVQDNESDRSDLAYTSQPPHPPTRSGRSPPPLHPPMQPFSLLRSEITYPHPTLPLTHPHPHPHSHPHPHPHPHPLPLPRPRPQHQPYPLQRLETNNPSPPPRFSHPIPALVAFDPDRVLHSQSPSTDTPPPPISTLPLSSTSYDKQQQHIPVAEGAVPKPKKLHREVEQKRRSRMSQQIGELRKWVSNPNGGKTDKVSVLQDAVTFVKESSTKMLELQAALDRSRAECAHLRSVLNLTNPPPLPIPKTHMGPPTPHAAPVSHLPNSVRHGPGAREDEVRHHSHYGVVQAGYEDPSYPPRLTETANQGDCTASLGRSNLTVTSAPVPGRRQGPPQVTASHTFVHRREPTQGPTASRHPASDFGRAVPMQAQQQQTAYAARNSESRSMAVGQRAMPFALYGPIPERSQELSPSVGQGHSQRERYAGGTLPPIQDCEGTYREGEDTQKR